MDESDDTHKNVPEEEKRLVRAVLFSEWGVPFDRFQKCYEELEGRPFPFKKLGFSSLKECLESIPDVVRFEYSKEASRLILYAVADDKSFMSSFTRKKQLSNTKAGLPQKRRQKRGSSSPRNRNQTKEKTERGATDDESKLVLSSRGLYSVIVRAGELSLDKEEMENLFKDTAPIMEVSSFQRQRGVYLFFRYKEKQHALAVIKKFNNYNYQGCKLVVKPAAEKKPVKIPTMPLPTNPVTTQHFLQNENTSETGTVCYDFQHGKCNRISCKYLNVPKAPPPPSIHTESSFIPQGSPRTRSSSSNLSIEKPIVLHAPCSNLRILHMHHAVQHTADKQHMTNQSGHEGIYNNQNSPRSSEGGSSSTSGSIAPPPLLDDDEEDDWDEDDEGYDGGGSCFQESGPPPLESDSDSEESADEDVGNKLNSVPNGYHSSNRHSSLGRDKVFSPGRGRGFLQFR